MIIILFPYRFNNSYFKKYQINELKKKFKSKIEIHDLFDVISKTKINGVSASSIFHYNVVNQFKIDITNIKIGNTDFLENFKKKKTDKKIISKIKNYLNKNKIEVRLI